MGMAQKVPLHYFIFEHFPFKKMPDKRVAKGSVPE
jgi:hypothetical protein